MARQNLEDGASFGEQRRKINENFTELYESGSDLIERYVCNGVNDNVILSQMCDEFFTSTTVDDNASKCIKVVGTVGLTEGPLTVADLPAVEYLGDGTWFYFGAGNHDKTRRITFDFENATIPSFLFNIDGMDNKYIMICVGSPKIEVKNANIHFTCNTIDYTYYAAGFQGLGTFTNCKATVKAFSEESAYVNAYGFFGEGKYVNCESDTLAVTSRYYGAEASGFWGNGEYINCVGSGRSTGFGEYNVAIGFHGFGRYINCKGTAWAGGGGSASSYGFSGSGWYVHCVGKATARDFEGLAIGFTGNGGVYTQCVGEGAGDGNGYGFYFSSSSSAPETMCINCRGIGLGGVYSAGYGVGFRALQHIACIQCVGMGLTPTGLNAFGFFASSVTGLIRILSCDAPLANKSGFNSTVSNVSGIGIAVNNSNIVRIKGCRIHSNFGVKVTGITNVENRVDVGYNQVAQAYIVSLTTVGAS